MAKAELVRSDPKIYPVGTRSGGSRGGSGGSSEPPWLEPPWRQNYFIFMGCFKKNYAKSTKRTPLGKFEPPLQKSWIHPKVAVISSVELLLRQTKVYQQNHS